MKQADQPAANICSGFVPTRVDPGAESLTSKRPSELRDAPSRPPVVWVLAVYSTFSRVIGMVDSLVKAPWLRISDAFRRRSGRSGRAGARCLQGRRPPQEIVDHRPGTR